MRDLGVGRPASGRFVIAAAVAAALLALIMLTPATLGAQEATHSADLTGDNEVPAVDTTATGAFTATVDETAQTITYTLSVPTIESATAAHIHQGAAGSNGPVVLALYTSDGENTIDVTQTLGAADLTGPLEGDWAGFIAGLADGSLYVNVHTTANPGGEIRGQVEAAVQAPAATPTPAAPAATPAPSTAPAPADTGNAGLGATAGMGAAAGGALLLAALIAVAGGRALTGRASRR